MEKTAIKTRRSGRVATIAIDRPNALNALNGSIIREITDQVEALSANDGVGAIVITGAGDKTFVAGADINQFATATPAAAEQLALLTKRMHDALRDERAFGLGILHSVHEPDALREASHSIAEKLASYSPYALGQLKAALNAAGAADMESACVAEIKHFALCFSTEDQKEGAKAFLEKRPPRYSGR